MNAQLNVLKVTREFIHNIVKDLSLKEIHEIPNGFNNNIAWNVAHLTVTQQLLQYKLSNLDCLVPDDLIENYKKGTKPSKNFTQEEWEDVLELFLGLPETLHEDFTEGIFKNYNEYPTSTGVILKTFEDSLAFNNFHEGIHLGSILALNRFIK